MLDRILLGSSGDSYFLSRPRDTDNTFGVDTREYVQPLFVDGAGTISVCAAQYDFLNGVGPFTLSRFTDTGATSLSKQINVSLRGQTMTRDSAGNYYIASVANGTTFYLYKLDANGAMLWQKVITTPSSTVNINGIRVDSTDANVYICGTRTVSATGYAFLVKITSAGTHSFTRVASTSSQFNSMALDSSNNIYCCGYFGSSGGLLVMKFTSTGTTSFTRRYYLSTGSTSVLGFGCGIACDNSFIYVTGTFNSLVHVVKMNLTGVIQWSRYANITSPWREAPIGVGYDSSGNVYMGQGNGSNAFALFKFDSAGTLLWQRQTSMNSMGIGSESIIVKNNILYVAATSYDGMGGASGIVIFKLPPNGSLTNGSTYISASYTVAAAPATINQAAVTVTMGTTAFTIANASNTVTNDNIYLDKVTNL